MGGVTLECRPQPMPPAQGTRLFADFLKPPKERQAIMKVKSQHRPGGLWQFSVTEAQGG